MSVSQFNPMQNEPPPQGLWTTISPFASKPLAAFAATFFAIHDLFAKSALQRGMPIKKMSLLQGVMEGFKCAPTVGLIVGSQMIFESELKKHLLDNPKNCSFLSTMMISAVVGVASAPFLAVFNGQTMGWTIRESFQKFNFRQGFAITVQETAFVASLSAQDHVTALMKRHFGEGKLIEYSAAFTSGALGSLASHPANTALTRWQGSLEVTDARQLMWGSLQKSASNRYLFSCLQRCKRVFGGWK